MYSKLYSRITESSLMEEPINVRYTFVLMLAIADPEGYVIGTNIAIARRLNMSLSEFEACLEVLMTPDANSNSKDFEGRRVVASDSERGYRIVNFVAYRDMKNPQDRREYMRDYMRRRRDKTNGRTEVVDSHKLTDTVNSVNVSKQNLAQLRDGDGDGDEDEDGIPVSGDFSNPRSGKAKPKSDKTTQRTSIFAKLIEDDLRSNEILMDWVRAASSRPEPIVGSSDADLLNIFGAAEHALKPGRAKKNAVALFVDIVRHQRWKDITQAEDESARKRLKVIIAANRAENN